MQWELNNFCIWCLELSAILSYLFDVVMETKLSAARRKNDTGTYQIRWLLPRSSICQLYLFELLMTAVLCHFIELKMAGVSYSTLRVS
jgi:hypothetical protein